MDSGVQAIHVGPWICEHEVQEVGFYKRHGGAATSHQKISAISIRKRIYEELGEEVWQGRERILRPTVS